MWNKSGVRRYVFFIEEFVFSEPELCVVDNRVELSELVAHTFPHFFEEGNEGKAFFL